FLGVGDRFADQAEGREMDHGADFLGLEQRLDLRLVADVALDEARARDRVAMPGGKIVEDDDGAAALAQELHHVRADVSRAPRDQDVHRHGGYYLLTGDSGSRR